MSLEEPMDKGETKKDARKRELARQKKESGAILQLEQVSNDIKDLSDDELLEEHNYLFDKIAKKVKGGELAELLEMERELTIREDR